MDETTSDRFFVGFFSLVGVVLVAFVVAIVAREFGVGALWATGYTVAIVVAVVTGIAAIAAVSYATGTVLISARDGIRRWRR